MTALMERPDIHVLSTHIRGPECSHHSCLLGTKKVKCCRARTHHWYHHWVPPVVPGAHSKSTLAFWSQAATTSQLELALEMRAI